MAVAPNSRLGPPEEPQAGKNDAAAAGATPRQILVDIGLVRNEKAARVRPFVARVRPDGQLEFLKAAIPVFEKGFLVGGKYRLNIGDLIIVRKDLSSHKNAYIKYILCRVAEDGVEIIAYISIHNGTPEFSSKELEEIYAVTEDATSRVIAALIQYARIKKLLG